MSMGMDLEKGLTPEEIADLVWAQVFAAKMVQIEKECVGWGPAVDRADLARQLAMGIWTERRAKQAGALEEG